MRRALVAGNWKMNASRTTARALAGAVAAQAPATVEVAICPPFPYLALVAECLSNSSVALGAQDIASEPPGAFTGEVAGEMLADVGCTMVLVGHSERRQRLAETDSQVAAKFARAVEVGIVPVLCLGETLEQREAAETEQVVARQLGAVLDACGGMNGGIIAYEPVWAIGSGRSASAQQAQDVHAFLRARLPAEEASSTRIVYGGSVNPGNAEALFSMADIDGGLIGGASLDADDFSAICRAAGS